MYYSSDIDFSPVDLIINELSLILNQFTSS